MQSLFAAQGCKLYVMTHRAAAIFVFMLALFTCGGCLPYRHITSPGVKGRVVDTVTNKPLGEEWVQYYTKRYDKPVLPFKSALTKANGEFSIPSVGYWSITMLPIDPARFTGTVEIIGPAHRAVTREFSFTMFGPGSVDLGTVKIPRKAK